MAHEYFTQAVAAKCTADGRGVWLSCDSHEPRVVMFRNASRLKAEAVTGSHGVSASRRLEHFLHNCTEKNRSLTQLRVMQKEWPVLRGHRR